MKKTIKFAIKSWKGRRPVNQDSLACSFNKANNFIAVVCDGVGSVKGSENASKIVTKVFTDEFEQTEKMSMVTPWFKQTLTKALNILHDYSIQNNCPNIATTIAALIIIDNTFYAYNIGDTRIYSFKKINNQYETKQYSYDHNYKNYLISKGLNETQLIQHKAKWPALTNLIDASDASIAKFDANSGKIDTRTHFLICTDGLYGYIKGNGMATVASTYLPMSWKLTQLNYKAYKNGSNDNISGILVRVK